MKKYKTVLIFMGISLQLLAQPFDDTLQLAIFRRSKYSIILDDTYLLVGFNTSGVYYSNRFREMAYGYGINLGIEQLYPLQLRNLISIGLQLSERNFLYNAAPLQTSVKNLYVDIPIGLGYELPILREIDLRMILGVNTAFRLFSTIRHQNVEAMPMSALLFEEQDLRRLDFGYLFGCSLETRHVLFRLRSFSGFTKIHKNELGMLNAFYIEIGYFLFREIHRKRKHHKLSYPNG